MKLDISTNKTIIAPFIFDGIQARLAAAAGFGAVYMSGFGTAASFGLPDLGLLTMTEMVGQASKIVKAVDLPVIADADTGYGNPLNVIRTVEQYQTAGVAAIHIEDQVFPKRCGFLAGKEVIPLSDMLAKLRAAADNRDPGFVIIGRTDALQPNGWDEVCRRAEAYMNAGADMVFVDGIRTRADLDVYCDRLGHLPLLYNGMLESLDNLESRGFRVVIHMGTMLKHFESFAASLTALKETGRIEVAGDSFKQAIEALGVAESLALAARYQNEPS